MGFEGGVVIFFFLTSDICVCVCVACIRKGGLRCSFSRMAVPAIGYGCFHRGVVLGTPYDYI